MMIRLLGVSALAVVLGGVLVMIAGQLGMLSGSAPSDLGVRDGKLKPPSRTRNSVSSQADSHAGTGATADYARIAPLAARDPVAAMQRLRGVLERRPDARVVHARSDYLHVEFRTRWMGFVDDAEFWASPGERVIHVRSGSRLGRSDFGVNRSRIEEIRMKLAETE